MLAKKASKRSPVFPSSGASGGTTYNSIDDVSALPQGQVYYRLKMEDTNGEFSYSPVKEIYLADAVLSLDVYPNPAKGQLNIDMLTQHPATSIRLIDLQGRAILHPQQVSQVNGAWHHTLDLKGFVPGCYLLEIVVGEEVLVKKVVVD